MYGYMDIQTMGKMTVEIKDELQERFRNEVSKRFGLHKGVLGKAITEAMEDWIRSE